MGMAMTLGKKEGSRKKLRILLLFFLKGFVTDPYSTTSRALAHKGAERREEEKWKKEETMTKRSQTAIQSTRPACKHAECVRHQVVCMLKRMLPIGFLFGYNQRLQK